MILPFEDLVEREKKGDIAVTPCTDFGAISIEMRLGKLFRRKAMSGISLPEEQELPSAEYLEQLMEEVPIPPQGIVLGPKEFYNWLPAHEVFLAKGLRGEITSRSSYARLGLRVDAHDDDLRAHYRDSTCIPLCSLATTGCKVLLRPNEPLAQLYVHDDKTPMLGCHQTLGLLRTGQLQLTRNGKKLKPRDLEVHGEPCLTMDDTIKLYRGDVLVPGAPKETDFETVTLTGKPIILPQGTFFLSASAEEFAVHPRYCGYVTEQHSIMTYQLKPASELWQTPFRSHANAPYLGPRNVFTGKITFENIMKQTGPIAPGMKQSELCLVPLTRMTSYTKESRYNGQQGATESRLAKPL